MPRSNSSLVANRRDGKLPSKGEFMKIELTETHLSFRFESIDYAFGAADAFLEGFKRDVPKKGRSYDSETRTWTILRLWESDFQRLCEEHFAGRLARAA